MNSIQKQEGSTSIVKSLVLKCDQPLLQNATNQRGKSDDILELNEPKRVALNFFTEANRDSAQPDIPKFSKKTGAVETELSYVIKTLVYGRNSPDFYAVKMAEILANDFEPIAAVKRDDKKLIVEFEGDFDASEHNISQENFDKIVIEASKEL